MRRFRAQYPWVWAGMLVVHERAHSQRSVHIRGRALERCAWRTGLSVSSMLAGIIARMVRLSRKRSLVVRMNHIVRNSAPPASYLTTARD